MWSSSSHLDVFILILGYKSPIVKQGCFFARDPVREASNIARVSVVGLSTHIISNTICQGRDWKLVAWFVMVLVSLHPQDGQDPTNEKAPTTDHESARTKFKQHQAQQQFIDVFAAKIEVAQLHCIPYEVMQIPDIKVKNKMDIHYLHSKPKLIQTQCSCMKHYNRCITELI